MEFYSSYFKITLSCLSLFALSAIITWLSRIYALRKAILDIPNERSSHSVPIPRGGGIAIVLTFTLSLLWLGWLRFVESNLIWALVGGGTAIAVMGYCDDVYSIKARWRILVHLIVAIWALYWLGGFILLDLGIEKISLHWLGFLLGGVGIVWCINLYNFMDGIDGLAGTEGVFIGLAGGFALWFVGAHNLALLMWLLGAAVAGFTIWNWPPAKIFLGDVGSGFLGYIFAVIAIETANKSLLPIGFWLVVLAVFLCDATFTLIYRMRQGKRWYVAHREHAYQDLVSFGASHKQVTMGIFTINCCILLPAAYTVLYWPTKLLWFVGGSILSIWLIWFWIKSLPVSLKQYA